MTDPVKFSYRAFISYSSKDRLIGEQFQSALERFKIPRPLRGRQTTAGRVPKRLTPIFRDRSDLEASEDLGQTIDVALTASQTLIVLCSPHSAQSKWVNQEIITFKRIGREHQIIAVLVDGEPRKYNPVTAPFGAFPPALVQRFDAAGKIIHGQAPEPFAPDLRDIQPDGSGGDGFEFAKLKVVARLIDIPLVELTQRQREAERRETRIIRGVAVLMMMLAIGATAGGWFAWQKNLEANNRLNDTIDTAARQIQEVAKYRDRYGVPNKVIQEMLEVAGRDFSRLTTTIGGRTPQLSLQNARLSLTFAEAYEEAYENAAQKRSLIEAEKELDWLNARKPSPFERLGLSPAPSQEKIARAQLRLMDAKVTSTSQSGDHAGALQQAATRLNLARHWSERTGSPDWRRQVALSQLSLGRAHYRGSKPTLSRLAFEAGIKEIEILLNSDDRPLYRKDLYDGVTWLGQLLVENSGHRAAIDQQIRAEKIARRLVLDEPDNKENKRSLAQVISLNGDALLNFDSNPEKPLIKYLEAEKLVRELVTSDSQRVDWQHDLYVILERRGSMQVQLGQFEMAEATLKEGAEIVERLLTAAPENAGRQRDVSVMQERLAQLYGQRAQMAMAASSDPNAFIDKASNAVKRLVEIRKRPVKKSPDDPVARIDLANALLTQSRISAFSPQRMGEAWQSLDEAMKLMKSLTAQPDTRLGWFRKLAAMYVAQSQFHMIGNSQNNAAKSLNQALDIIVDLRKQQPDNERFKIDEVQIKKQIANLNGE